MQTLNAFSRGTKCKCPNEFTLNAFARLKRGKYAHGIKSTKVGVTTHAPVPAGAVQC